MKKTEDIKRAIHALIQEATLPQLKQYLTTSAKVKVKNYILLEKAKFEQYAADEQNRALELQTVHDNVDIDLGG